MMKNITIIIPVYNEELSIHSLYSELKPITDNHFNEYEVIFIDDGSNDSSFKIINEISSFDPNVIAIKLNRNYGKSDALNEGFKIAKYDYIVTLDADLQDDPNEIIKLVDILDKGWDCVSGWKKNRKDPLSKTIPSFFFNKFVNFLSGLKIHDLNCGIKSYKKDAIQSINIYGGLHRYIPLLLFNNGYNVTEHIVNHRPRLHGHTKYGKSRFFHGIFDFLTIYFLKKYFNKPMYFFGSVGLLLSGIGLLINAYLSCFWIYNNYLIDASKSFTINRPLLFLGILLLVVGIQSLSIGLIGELIVHTSRKKDKKIKKIVQIK